VVNRRKVVLPAGITASDGDFESGDVVDCWPRRVVVAGAFVGPRRRDAEHLGRIAVRTAPERRHPVVHADDLIAVTQARQPGRAATM
jgi:glutamate 5-kinase